MGFACHGLLVREFNHHLRYYSDGGVDDFENVEGLLKYKDIIIRNVKMDLRIMMWRKLAKSKMKRL